MTHLLDEICTIFKPVFDDTGVVVFEESGDYFCRIERGGDGREFEKYVTHKAKVGDAMNGVMVGDRLITTHNEFVVVSINRKTERVGLIIQR